MCIYGYVSLCIDTHTTARKLDFSYWVTTLKCQDLAECHVIGIQYIFMEFNVFYISNYYYCFCTQNNHKNPLAFVIWANTRDSRASWPVVIWSCRQLSFSVNLSYLTNEWACKSTPYPHHNVVSSFSIPLSNAVTRK